MLCIKEISFSDYLFSFTLSIPPLGIYYVRHSQLNEGLLLGTYLDEMPIGVAIVVGIGEKRCCLIQIKK